MGKPVLGIINVKLGITEQVRSLDMKRLRNKMAERERIETICNQFRQFAGNFQQDWGDLTFVPVHLKAAYLGQDKNPELWEVSNFTAVEDYILSKVQRDGCFLRIKTFLDRVIIPLQGRMEMLYENSGSSLTEAFEYQKKCQELVEWNKIFVEESQEKFDNLYKRLHNKLANGIAEFAEYNYDNEDAGEDWKEYLQEELKLEADCMSFLQERSNKCSRKRRELMDSLKTELTFAGVNVEFEDISMDSITDTQLLGTIAGGALALVFPVAGIAVTLINWLFGSSKEEKIREAKAKLRDALQDAMDECGYVDTLMDSVANTMNEEIFGKGVDGLYNALAQMDAMLIGLAKEEATGAEKLGVLLNKLNCQLWHEAEGYVAAQEGKNLVLSVDRIARIPGEVTEVYDSMASFEGYEAKMTKLIGEKVELRILDNAGNFYGEMVKNTEELIGSFGIEQVGAFAKVFNEDEVPGIQPAECKLAEIKANDRYRLVYQYMGMPMVQ